MKRMRKYLIRTLLGVAAVVAAGFAAIENGMTQLRGIVDEIYRGTGQQGDDGDTVRPGIRRTAVG